MPRIDCMYAFVAEDSEPEDEGIIGMQTDDGWLPLVGADMARVESLKPVAQAIAQATGKRVKLLHFAQRKEVEVLG